MTLDPEMRKRLNGLNKQMEVRDEQGYFVGVFLPAEAYQNLLSTGLPFSREEIEPYTLEQIWKELGAK